MLVAHVAIVSPHPLTRHGLEGLLVEQRGRVRIVDAPSDGNGDRPDVVFYDAAELHSRADEAPLRKLVESCGAPVIAVAPHFRPDLCTRSWTAGATAVVTLAVNGPDLVELVEAVTRGTKPAHLRALPGVVGEAPPGAGVGLTEREQQIIAMIATGMSNHEIGRELFLSINTIKTYVRQAYRRMGVTSRSQAVRWALDHNLYSQESV